MTEATPASAPLDEVSPVPMIDLVSQYQPIEDEILEAVKKVFSEQRFILGDEVAEFECDVAEYCDSRDSVGCASGTDALILSLMALNIGPGDEVITSPYTFFATASSIARVGAKPVFVDIEPHSYNLNPEAVEAAITERTRAIMPVHLFGQCADMEPLWRVAVRGGLAIIEDACQAIGADYRGRRAGVLGTVGCFSFFPTKNLGGAGDGGLVTSDDAELCARLRRLRVHGDAGRYQHLELGLNSRLDALQAAVLRVKLRHLEEWTIERQENARRYSELFRHYQLLDTIELPTVLPERRHVFNQFAIRVKGGRRDDVRQHLQARKIGCAVYYPIPLHLQECFLDLGHKVGDFPESEAASRESLCLPISPGLTADQQESIVCEIASVLGRLPAGSTASITERRLLENDSKAA